MLAAKLFKKGPFRLIQAFIEERGHGCISFEVMVTRNGEVNPELAELSYKLRQRSAPSIDALNPHIKAMLDDAGFVFNVNLWVVEQTVQIMERYCQQTGGDINLVPKDFKFEGFGLGAMLQHWRCSGGTQWMKKPEFKQRMDNIGFDLEFDWKEAQFRAKCQELKEWYLANDGRKLKQTNTIEERRLYHWRQAHINGHMGAIHMNKPHLRAIFDDACSAAK